MPATILVRWRSTSRSGEGAAPGGTCWANAKEETTKATTSVPTRPTGDMAPPYPPMRDGHPAKRPSGWQARASRSPVDEERQRQEHRTDDDQPCQAVDEIRVRA